jgi:hypothetical protein
VPDIDVDGDQVPDLRSCDMAGISTSAGSFAGVAFKALAPCISHAYINVAGGLTLRSAEAGSFGERIEAGLAAAGVFKGTPEYEQFLTVGTTVLDAADPVNWAKLMVMRIPILHNMVQDDDTVPNRIPGFPLGGNEGLNSVLGLESFSSSRADPEGLRAVSRFLPPAAHDSLFRPGTAPQVTIEMQTQMASFVASGGTFVQVDNPDLLEPVVDTSAIVIGGPAENRVDPPGKGKGKDGSKSVDKPDDPRLDSGPLIFKRPNE